MKTIKYISVFTLVLFLVSCYEQENPIEDLYESDGREYPVISEWFVQDEIGATVSPGDALTLDLRYWSVAEIDRIVLSHVVDGEESEVETKTYVENFNEETQTDQMLFDYTVPQPSADTSEVSLYVEIINVNGLTRKTGDGSRSGTRSPVVLTVVQ